MLYSIRMRAAENGPHEKGGRHISGAERLVDFKDLEATAVAMLTRAFTHSRGQADFININIEYIPQEQIIEIPILPIYSTASPSVVTGRAAAVALLIKAGVNPKAAESGLSALANLTDSMRGAIIMCAKTGNRLDNTGNRGIRVSRMDIADEQYFGKWLVKNGLSNIHIREALVLASKVAAAPGIVAELCWSDDPEYTTGYVASKEAYHRLTNLKQPGSPVGGRIFFIAPGTNLNDLITYLQEQPVIVKIPG